MRLILRAPYNHPLTFEQFFHLPWPPCPGCGAPITVTARGVLAEGKRELVVGARTLPAVAPEQHAVTDAWQCAGRAGESPCGAEGSA